MKKYLLVLSFISTAIASFGQQGFGFDVGFSTSKAPMIAAKYFFDKNAVSAGASYQVFNNALGKKRELMPGDSVIGDGDYFYSIDIGYTRILNDKFSISGEISFGKKIFYQNIGNISFPDGGYHINNYKKAKSEIGGGAFLTYYLSDMFGLFAGYNSLRQASIGLDVRFLKQQ